MSGNQEAYQKALELGHSAAWDQMWDRAAAFYRQALEEFPDQPTALANLGLALYEMKDYDNALRIYQRNAAASPQDPVSHEKIGQIAEHMGRPDEAVEAYTRAADLYLKARDVEKSIFNWTQVLRLQENLLARMRLAMIHDKLGHKPEAVNEFLAAASLMQRAGDPTKALQAVGYAQQLMPDSGDVKQAVAMLHNNQLLPRPGRPRAGAEPNHPEEPRQMEIGAGSQDAAVDPISEARQAALVMLAGLLFDQAEETNPEGQASKRGINAFTRGTGGLSLAQAERTRILLHLGQAIDSQTKGEEAQAVEELERTVDAGLRHPAALFDLGLLVHLKDPQKALRHFQESVSHPSFALASYLLMGKIYYDSGSMSEASMAYLQALRLADSETVNAEEADELRQLYEPIMETQSRQADPALLKGLCESVHAQLIRSDWRLYLNMARQQLPAQPEGSPPLPLAEMMFENRGGHVVELLAQIRSLAKQNKLLSATEEAYYALQYAPTYLPLHIQIAELLLQAGYLQSAIDKFMLVADLYALRGESSQAIRLFNRMLEVAPMNLSVRTRLIELLQAQGKNEDAVQQYLNLAEIYYQLAEMDKARQAYSSALKVTQQSRGSRKLVVRILYKIADIDMQRLDLRNAMRMYEQIRTLEPEDVHGRARLVELNFRMSQEAAALNEVDAFLALLENSSQHGKAIEFLKELLNEQPDSREIRKRLAGIYQRGGKQADAIREWELVLDQAITRGDKATASAALQSLIALNPPARAEYQKQLNQLQRLS